MLFISCCLLASRAFTLAVVKLVRMTEDSSPMIEMTTSNSIKVKPFLRS